MSRIVYRITDQYAIVERARSPFLYLEWRERGQKVGRTTGTASLDAAKQRAREIILEEMNLRDEKPEETPLLALLDRYYLQHGHKLASKDTVKRAVALWREYWGEDATLSDMPVARQEGFVSWLIGKGLSDGYTRRVIGVGRTALNRAVKRQEVTSAPFVELPPEGEAYEHAATRAQLVTFLNAPMPEHLWAYTLIRLNTCCRGDAAKDLQPFQVDFEQKKIRLNPAGRRQTKKRRPVVPLTRTLEALLKPMEGVEFYSGWHGKRNASNKTTWRKVRVKAGLPAWFVPKVLRHTVSTELRRRGVRGWDVSGLMGHVKGEGAATTQDYAKFDGDKVRKALDAWMLDLSKDVPKLAGVTAGLRKPRKKLTKSLETPMLQVVGGTGFEPVTPTMSRSRNIRKIND